MHRGQSIAFPTIAVTLVLVLIGCNREGLPGLGSVTGTITMDGKPVPDAMVAFDAVDGSAAPAMGRTDANGMYELYYSRNAKGAKIGEHTVRITTYQESGDEDKPQVHKETIPSRYNVKTELKATVNRGNNKIDFELKSGGEIVQPNEEAPAKKGRSRTGCA